MTSNEINVTGTLMWYYNICHREVWLMSHQVVANQDDSSLDYGRFLQEKAYPRDKKEITVGHLKFDLLRRKGDQVIIGEVKKTSKYEKSAIMQLGLYLYELKELGVDARGELLFPEEKKRVEVELTPDLEKAIEVAKEEILKIICLEKPPKAEKGRFCKKCAYQDLCWA